MRLKTGDFKMIVSEKVRSFFEKTSIENLKQKSFIENELILTLGLNDELLSEQPQELSEHYGKGFGLRIWQYPNQFSSYLSFIQKYAKNINSYLEIGCRFAGTFILTTEYLIRLNSNFNRSIAVDILDPVPTLSEYLQFNNSSNFKKINSLSIEFKEFIQDNFFDVIFIDGDHSYEGVKNDSELTRDKCNIQVFHDIASNACPGVVKYWEEVKENYKDTHNFYEFVEQYESVIGSYLGIGLAIRKEWINEV
jgi:hypothetical protein